MEAAFVISQNLTCLLVINRSFLWISTYKWKIITKASFRCIFHYWKSGLKFYHNTNNEDDTLYIVKFFVFKAYYH